MIELVKQMLDTIDWVATKSKFGYGSPFRGISRKRVISRLCLHPKYRKKNFLSWFISRCLWQLDKKFKCVISYCDTTQPLVLFIRLVIFD
jgi:hypothetical protein